jgi:subtilisin family serine protease
LRFNLWRNNLEIPGNNIDDDGNGYIDDINGWNFLTDSSNVQDDMNHGTRVAGVIAAKTNNNTDIAGVAPGASLMILRVLDSSGGLCTSFNYTRALLYARHNGAAIANQSLEGIFDSTKLAEFVQAYDFGNTNGIDPQILNIISAGNKAINLDNDTTNNTFPAEVNRANALVVASTNSADQKDLGSSNFGGNTVDIGAPGVLIQTTELGGGTAICDGIGLKYSRRHFQNLSGLHQEFLAFPSFSDYPVLIPR